MKYIALALFLYASYRFARFTLEPDYLRCATGEDERRDIFNAVEKKIDEYLRKL